MTDHDCAEVIARFGECIRCLAEPPAPAPAFAGVTFVAGLDGARLGAQAQRVWDAIADGAWRSLATIAEATGDPEASVSARLRDYRKDGWGGHRVERRRVTAGVHEYRLVRETNPPAR